MGRLLDDTYLKPFEAANRGKGMKLVMSVVGVAILRRAVQGGCDDLLGNS